MQASKHQLLSEVVMLEFIKFDKENKEHVQWAINSQDIIFEDNDGIMRFGHLWDDYHGNGTSTYRLSSGDYGCNAEYQYFCPILKKD